MSEAFAEPRLKRLRMRAWRRGTKEMDLLLGPFADERLAGMDPGALERFENLLAEPDGELLAWILGRADPPGRHAALVAAIRGAAESRRRGGAGPKGNR